MEENRVSLEELDLLGYICSHTNGWSNDALSNPGEDDEAKQARIGEGKQAVAKKETG